MQRHVAVIGCGAIGAATAIALLDAGHRVSIIEPASPGGDQAASYGNAGWLSCQSVIPTSVPGMWKKVPGYLLDPLGPLAMRWTNLPQMAPWLIRYLLAGRSFDRIERTAAALAPLLAGTVAGHTALATAAGVGHLIAGGGVVHAFPSRDAFAKEAWTWALRARVGIVWRELEGPALRAEVPGLPERYRFAVIIDDAGRCRDPGAYVAALARLACARGATLVAARAEDFQFDGARLTGLRTDRGVIACDAAVICAGARSKALTARLGETKPLASERGYHVHVDGAEAGLEASFMVSDGKIVAHQMTSGLRVAGQVEIAAIDAAPDWRRAEILKRHLSKLFPQVDVSGAKMWLGHRPAMPDGRPCLGRSRRSADVIFAFGHGHVGLVAAPATARVVTALLADQAPDIAIDAFAPNRFS